MQPVNSNDESDEYGSVNSSNEYGSEDSSDETKQSLEYAGLFGGHSCTMCFFAAFEGFTCLWLLLVILMLFTTRSPFLLIFVLFGCCFHCCTQAMLSMFDPGKVSETLGDMERGMEDESTAALFEELRRTPASVKVLAEAYHTETSGSGEQQSTRTVIDHMEEENFLYASWKDVSGCVDGLDEYKFCAVEVVPKIEFADADTATSLNSVKERLLDECRRYRSSVRSSDTVSLKHPKHEVCGSRVFVTRSAGEDLPSWMTKDAYTMCRFAGPCCGTLYRTLFLISITNVRYTITKLISTNKQAGPGWIEV